MIRLLLALSFLGVACGPQQRVAPCSPSSTTGEKPPIVVVLAGNPVDVELLLPPAVFCEEGNPVATSVGTEVMNTLNEPVPHTHGPPTSSDTRGYATTVTFTPSAPGVYFLSARFEPSLGLIRRQVQVVANRLAETPAVRVPATVTCDEVAGLEPFAVCLRGSELTVLSDAGVTYAESTVVRVAASEGTAWWWTTTSVTRADVVSGALRRVTLPLVLGNSRAASVSSAVLAQGTSPVTVVRFDGDAGLQREAREAPLSPVLSLSRNGDLFGFGGSDSLCATDGLPDGGVRCVSSVGLVPSASEANVMWLRGAETGVVALARVPPPPLKDPDVLFLEAQASVLVDTKQPTPAFTWAGKFISVRRQDLTLEAWEPPPGMLRRAVTEEYVVFQTRTEVLLFRR